MIEEHIDQLFRMSHQCTLKIRIQALVLLFQYLKSSSSLPDRFFRVLYELVNISFRFCIKLLQLLTEELKINSSCQTFFDVLYSALKEDYSLSRVKAFIKRLLQVATHAEPPFIISTLLLIAKLLQSHLGALSLLKFSEHNKFSEEEADETFQDVPDEEDDELFKNINGSKPPAKPKANALLISKEEQGNEAFSSEYDSYKRDPQYANADNTLIYELLLFKEHYHPTVRLYSSKILEGVQKNVNVFDYNGNAWLDHSLANFLDRISFKRPKKFSGSKQSTMRLSKLVAPISETVNFYRFWIFK